MTKAVVFDAYGTIVKIGKKLRPYHAVISQAKQPLEKIVNPLITNISFEEYSKEMGVSYTRELSDSLNKELKSIVAFPEVKSIMEILRKKDIKIAVCSNLAQPYAQPIIDLFGDLVDEYVWSFEAGVTKPSEAIYRLVEERLGLTGEDIYMVGDTYDCDYEKPRQLGWHSVFLDRKGKSTHPSISRLNSIFLDVK